MGLSGIFSLSFIMDLISYSIGWITLLPFFPLDMIVFSLLIFFVLLPMWPMSIQ
jgi:hypothetical protein